MPVAVSLSNAPPTATPSSVMSLFGLVVRVRNVFSNIGAQLMTIGGGEVVGYTKLLTDSRSQVYERLAPGHRCAQPGQTGSGQITTGHRMYRNGY
jgi:hypothetical protein